MKTNKYIAAFMMLMAFQSVKAQESISYNTFEQKVLEYSQTLKQSKANQTAMQKLMEEVKTSFFPSIELGGNYQYRINDYAMDFGTARMEMEHDSYNVDLVVAQPIYAGGSIYHNYKSKEIQKEIAGQSVELTIDNIILAAQNSYWGTVAQKDMYETTCRYTEIIENLVQDLKHKYEDGLISKTDLIQMEARLMEAKLQQSNALENYCIAKQNMNLLMGKEPMTELTLTDSISKGQNQALAVEIESAWNYRPELTISQLNIEYQKRQMKLATSQYNPTISVGFQETWGTSMLNMTGENRFNSTVFVSAKIPLVHWGARFKSKAAQKALLLDKQYAYQDKKDQINKELCNAWTSMTEANKQIDFAKRNCELAEENLELNTFSYTEGRLPIVDVLSAQLTWIQAYTNLIQTYYKAKMALANYRKAAGLRYME